MDAVLQVIEIGCFTDIETESRAVEVVDTLNPWNQILSALRCRVDGQITAFRVPSKYDWAFRITGIQILKRKILGRNRMAESGHAVLFPACHRGIGSSEGNHFHPGIENV